jgi:hypothetical protein
MTVRELLARIGQDELFEWQAYYRIEPFGEWREDLRCGIVASTVANAFRGKKSKTFKPDDFMPKFGKGDPEKRRKGLAARLLGMFGVGRKAEAE